MAIHRYLINLLWLYTTSMRSLIYATNSKLDLSHAVNIAYFFIVFLYITRRKINSLHFTSLWIYGGRDFCVQNRWIKWAL